MDGYTFPLSYATRHLSNLNVLSAYLVPVLLLRHIDDVETLFMVVDWQLLNPNGQFLHFNMLLIVANCLQHTVQLQLIGADA